MSEIAHTPRENGVILQSQKNLLLKIIIDKMQLDDNFLQISVFCQFLLNIHSSHSPYT